MRTNSLAMLEIAVHKAGMIDSANPRGTIQQLARERDISLAALSRMIGQNAAYLAQFISLGTPRRLPEEPRRRLAMALDVDERLLGARDPWTPILTATP